MDNLPINENINFKTRMHASVYIGVIKEFFKDTWEITFRVPLIIDKLDKYPRAVPLFHHEYELFPNDEVVIFVTTQADPTQCYYVPITLYKFIGMKHGVNFVDITKDGIIDLETDNFYSFAINNSEHRTLNKSTIVSNEHQLDTNNLIINIPINSDTQQDIIENRNEPVVEPNSVGSRITNIIGDDIKKQIGNTNINIDGSKNVDISENYSVIIDKFTKILNKSNDFIYGKYDNDSTGIVKENAKEFYCNNKDQVGLTGIYGSACWGRPGDSNYTKTGYIILALVNGRVVGIGSVALNNYETIAHNNKIGVDIGNGNIEKADPTYNTITGSSGTANSFIKFSKNTNIR